MSLDRKDVRIKLDPDDHQALLLVAEAEDKDIGQLVEELVVRVVRRRIHAAMVLAKKAERLGIAGKPIPSDD